MEMPSSSNGAKARARKPDAPHISSVETLNIVTPRRHTTAVTAGGPSASAEMRVPSEQGSCAFRMCSGIPAARTGPRQRGCSTLAPIAASSSASR